MKCALLFACLAVFPAAADTTYIVSVSNRVTEAQPSATVEVWAVFDEDLYAMAGGRFEFAAAPDPGAFSEPQRLLKGPGTKDGEVSESGDRVTGIVSGQLPGFPIEPPVDKSNPVGYWRVTWSTDDFTPRTVSLRTITTSFDVYLDPQGVSKSFLDQLVEGEGVIEVGSEPCAPDCTADGTLDLFDFLCFVNQFNAEAPEADCDGSGGLDLFDFLCFVNAFNSGC